MIENHQVRRQPDDVVEVVRDEDQRNVERSSQLVDLILQPPSHRTIDGGKRFVEQEHRRLARECTRQRDPLALTARQLVRPAIVVIGQVHQVEQLIGARARRSPRGDARAPSSRFLSPSGAERARIPETPRQQRGDGAERRYAPLYRSTCLGPVGTRACAGDSSPAMLRRIVVLPLPDGPKMASTSPGSHVNSTSSAIGAGCRRLTNRRRSATTRTYSGESVVVSISVTTAIPSSVAAMMPALRSSKACIRS